MIERFRSLINQYASISEEELGFMQDKVAIRSHKKNEVFFKEGQISQTIYFVLQGCVRLFYNADGVDKTAYFYTEGKFICAGESFTYNVPAIENYQAIEDTVLMHFEKETFDELFQHFPGLEIIGRIATEDELISCQKMIASFITKSPEERYVELLASQRELFQRVNQQYIASYIGVSPETLSRIKRRVVLKEQQKKT